MEKETYKIMEYDRIREMLADRASSRIGKEQAKTLEPSSDFDEVAEWLAETTEAVTVLETAMPPFGGIFDIRPLLKKAKMGAVLVDGVVEQAFELAENLDAARPLLERRHV